MPSIVKIIFKDSILITLSNVLQKISYIVLYLVSARTLELNQYAILIILLATLSLFYLFSNVGLASSATKLAAENFKLYSKTVIYISFLFSCLISIIYISSIDYIANDIYKSKELTEYLYFLCPIMIVMSVSGVYSGLFKGVRDYSLLLKLNLVTIFPLLTLIYPFAHLYGLHGVMYVLLISEVLKLIISIYYGNRLGLNKSEFNINVSIKISKLAIPFAISGLMILPVNWYLMKEVYISYESIDLVILNTFEQWFMILLFVPYSIGNALLPIISGKDYKGSDLFRITLIAKLILSVIGAIFLIIFSDFIFSLYKVEVPEKYEFLIFFLLPLSMFVSVSDQFTQYLLKNSKTTYLMIVNSIWAFTTLLTALFLFDSYELGIYSILLGRVIGYVVKLTIMVFSISNGERSFYE